MVEVRYVCARGSKMCLEAKSTSGIEEDCSSSLEMKNVFEDYVYGEGTRWEASHSALYGK